MLPQDAEDADRLLRLPWYAYPALDAILQAEAAGSRYYEDEMEEDVAYLKRKKVIEGDWGRYGFVMRMEYRPFFERYASAVHEIAEGTNDDRLRVAGQVRRGTWRPARDA